MKRWLCLTYHGSAAARDGCVAARNFRDGRFRDRRRRPCARPLSPRNVAARKHDIGPQQPIWGVAYVVLRPVSFSPAVQCYLPDVPRRRGRASGRLSRPHGAHHRRLSARRLDRHRRANYRQLAESRSLASSSSSRTSPAPAIISARNWSPRRRRTATLCSWLIRRTQSTPRSTRSSISCSCATSIPWPISSRCRM